MRKIKAFLKFKSKFNHMGYAMVPPLCQKRLNSAQAQITITNYSQSVLGGRKKQHEEINLHFLEAFPSTFVSKFHFIYATINRLTNIQAVFAKITNIYNVTFVTFARVIMINMYFVNLIVLTQYA